MGHGATGRERMTAGVLEADPVQVGIAFLDGEQAQRFICKRLARRRRVAAAA
jgi:hypothetical protein